MISLILDVDQIIIKKDQFKYPFELIRHAKKHNILPTKNNNEKPEIKEGEYLIPKKEKSKEISINPLTGRDKKQNISKYYKTNIPPEERTLKNLPKDSTGKSIVRFQDWLLLKNTSKSNHSVGQSPDGSWYGWSHRAIYGFKVGDIIKPGSIGNKFEYSDEVEKKYNEIIGKDGIKEADNYRKTLSNFEPYEIKTDQEAFEHADRFAKDVS